MDPLGGLGTGNTGSSQHHGSHIHSLCARLSASRLAEFSGTDSALFGSPEFSRVHGVGYIFLALGPEEKIFGSW